MKKNFNIATEILFALIGFIVVSCEKLDVVGNDSIRSFGELLQNTTQSVSEDTMNGGWSLSAPDNTARFIWSRNYAESSLYDVMLEFDAAPFIAAGLNLSRLPDHFTFYENILMAGTKLGNDRLEYSGEITPLASYEKIVKLKRSAIGYHMQMDHYGINLGNGNIFEWAKNLSTNDKDIVFVLEPEPFIKAGVNPNNIEGWLYAQVTVDDKNGKPIQVYKFLKPFNLL
jgi:hypothetical protein